MDQVYLPFYRTFMIKEKGAAPTFLVGRVLCRQGVPSIVVAEKRAWQPAGDYEAKMKRLFREWDFDCILPCHGDFVPANGKAVLKQHLGL